MLYKILKNHLYNKSLYTSIPNIKKLYFKWFNDKLLFRDNMNK